ncbi:OLC1v1028131C1 [Oldenlandia corymbosa var. corymbosa]|uniref:OLC1v1028131C1 n=1 Tax=Oldenlandia corymbosa var. corymbosa TaxID=529605 RepID=A0AAV1CCV0_OLDCO|nr:OLC1v1028131C1 [Oldenlandia corymbosa var. corymbosa]
MDCTMSCTVHDLLPVKPIVGVASPSNLLIRTRHRRRKNRHIWNKEKLMPVELNVIMRTIWMKILQVQKRSWLKCMGGRTPKAIITDQCAAMRIAIQELGEVTETMSFRELLSNAMLFQDSPSQLQ